MPLFAGKSTNIVVSVAVIAGDCGLIISPSFGDEFVTEKEGALMVRKKVPRGQRPVAIRNKGGSWKLIPC